MLTTEDLKHIRYLEQVLLQPRQVHQAVVHIDKSALTGNQSYSPWIRWAASWAWNPSMDQVQAWAEWWMWIDGMN